MPGTPDALPYATSQPITRRNFAAWIALAIALVVLITLIGLSYVPKGLWLGNRVFTERAVERSVYATGAVVLALSVTAFWLARYRNASRRLVAVAALSLALLNHFIADACGFPG